ncbi:uncharacterized protein LOC122077753 isoform X2 [Macadamia integrifolia]|uniref:uncharacterized protein LOC122077753 isoform X2 n=1 Tax=Macadamia integrifolia TaxID=60698 RepID=UPI001C4F982F|nr:uncharacterized protein LOC122077753 isoform X2 [Macadamia integrifolia]
MAYDGSLCSYYFPSIIDSDLQSLGVFKADMSLGMDPAFSSDLSTGTGYLQDAILAWSNRCKRRRISSYSHEQVTEYSKNCWNSEDHEDPFEKFGSFVQNYNLLPERNPLQNWVNRIDKGRMAPVEKKPVEHVHHKTQLFSLSFSHMDSTNKDPHQKIDPSTIKDNCCVMKVAYPFDMVKPGGIEGDVTLEDINERMLMRPTRPVRHPVGDLACRPVAMAGGLGLSGKAVVALTRIRTRGRGTVTIIRTRG